MHTSPIIRRAFAVLVPLIVLTLWLGVGAVGGPTFGKLSSVATNDQGSFLPASADSTKVQALATEFSPSTAIPALVVVESSGKLTPTDLRQLQALTPALARAPGVAQHAGSVIGPVPSKDGRAAEYAIQLTGKFSDNVPRIRTIVNAHIAGDLKGYVTGPAGLAADLFSAFKGIDGILLYVALIAVFVILLLVYRSIILPFLVLGTAMLGLSAAGLAVYHGVQADLFKLNGQSQGILSILAIGAATDYSLLIIARYREALEKYESSWEAMKHALKTSFEPITASAATVVAGVLCLLFSQLNSNKDLGPVAALGIAFSYLAAMTFLPALLVLFGRAAFWPFRPQFTPGHAERQSRLQSGIADRKGLWRKVPELVAAHPRALWLTCLVVLCIFAAMATQFRASGVSQSDTILGASDAVTGQKVLAAHFPAGTGSPAIIIANAAKVKAVADAVQATPGVTAVIPYANPQASTRPVIVNGNVMLDAVLAVPADSAASETVVRDLRTNVKRADPSALVGGVSAIMLDSNDAASSDIRLIIPIVLTVILLILILLLRSLVAPALLIASVILSFTATIGISALVFNYVLHFAGSDAAIPLFGFIFLVALGVDYNIFLMTRVREEAKQIGTRSGILRGLSVTGSVITSAGIVLAATFAALAVVPILFLVQIAFIVAFGVLLDTIVVRSLLIPAVCYDLGRPIWWPSKLWRGKA